MRSGYGDVVIMLAAASSSVGNPLPERRQEEIGEHGADHRRQAGKELKTRAQPAVCRNGRRTRQSPTLWGISWAMMARAVTHSRAGCFL